MPYPYNSLDGREDPNAAGRHVLRGGSWASSAEQISTFYRLSIDPALYAVAGNDVGFRCVRNANP
jgi:formylglycine-generating enzyme required for sulfatase activity